MRHSANPAHLIEAPSLPELGRWMGVRLVAYLAVALVTGVLFLGGSWIYATFIKPTPIPVPSAPASQNPHVPPQKTLDKPAQEEVPSSVDPRYLISREGLPPFSMASKGNASVNSNYSAYRNALVDQGNTARGLVTTGFFGVKIYDASSNQLVGAVRDLVIDQAGGIQAVVVALDLTTPTTGRSAVVPYGKFMWTWAPIAGDSIGRIEFGKLRSDQLKFNTAPSGTLFERMPMPAGQFEHMPAPATDSGSQFNLTPGPAR